MVRKKEKAVIVVLLSTVFLCACNPPSQSGQNKQSDSRQAVTDQAQSKEMVFDHPKDQYGLKYWVGNLGGKPVQLPQTIFTVWEYDDSPDTWGGTKEEMAEYKKRPRTYDSIIKSMSFDMRYSDGILREFYYKAPSASREKYEREHNRPDSKWLDISVYSGQRYGAGDMNFYWNNRTEKTQYEHLNYHPTDRKIYGLQEYALENQWRYELMAEDMYVHKNENNDVTTVISCTNGRSQSCEQRFLLLPEFKAKAVVRYTRINLKDWQIIQERVHSVMKTYIINKK